MTWTDEQEQLFREQHAAGVSFGEIARQLGITRAAACGKAWRLKLESRRVAPTTPRVARRPRRVARRVLNFGNRLAVMEVDMPDALMELPPEVSPFAVALMQLEPQHCRWPVNGDDKYPLLFCGAPKVAECSYCARHRRLGHRTSCGAGAE